MAGAALSAIHPIARSDHAIGKLWRQRLALSCAEAVVRMQGRGEDAKTLRDHHYLTRKGDDPGPAGKMLAAWHLLGSTGAARSRSWLSDLAGLLSITIDEPFEDVIHERMDRAAGEAAGQGSPVAAAADVVVAVLNVRPDARPLALWLADLVLARRLKWPAPVPLLAAHVRRDDLRLASGPHADPDRWRAACALAYARGAAAAHALYTDLARRSEPLLEAAQTLRSKDAGETVLRLLSEDALLAQSGKTTSDRSGRRLFERLVELGVVRELTGRPTFRLYGL